ncbi:MAG: iron ABC transporter permease [Bacteroidales bacterium]|nr:iron ABC transporter permease [Bacteroidales bacterium]
MKQIHPGKGPHTSLLIIFLLAIAAFLFMLDLVTGPVEIPFRLVFTTLLHPGSVDPVWKQVMFDFRIPKALTAVVAGSALAVSGLQMQTVFRNPLAGPDVLGISSGAGLGVALVVLGFGRIFSGGEMLYISGWIQIAAAWAGAAVVLFLVMAVSLRVRDIMTILILGILFGSAVSAVVSILQYFSEQAMLKTYVIWTMGSLGSLTNVQLNVLLVSIVTGFIISVLSLKRMNILLTGETYARSLGLNQKSSRILIFLSTSILTGSVTAFCGPIGFVGIAVPHLARLLFRSADHKVLFPGSILLGAIMLLISDLVSQMPPQDTHLPVNAVTALLGIPIVMWIIFKNQRLVSVS